MSQMREEIHEQPASIERTLNAEWPEAEKLKGYWERHPVRLVVLAARGTSDNAAQFGRYLLEITTGIPVSLAAPSVCTLYHAKLHWKDALVVGLSQSGESTDVNLVLEAAREAGAFTIGITNEPESTLAHIAAQTFCIHAGREKSVAATKTYTGQLACLYLLAYALGAPLKREDLQALPGWTAAALRLEPEIRARAERYCFMRSAVCIGRGLNYANSFEFALKLMETCYVVAERFSSADLLHGPIAMLEPSFPAFLFCPPGPTWRTMHELVDRLDSMRIEIVPITDRSHPGSLERPLVIPESLTGEHFLPADLYTPIPYIVPAQLFAARLAEIKGLDPDHPRALSKITQTV
jgi:glucosamine--fructose-6-phosphate aminotransferase (isomerizing)